MAHGSFIPLPTRNSEEPKNYHRFGVNETIDDLEVLCWECHQDTHETEEKFWVYLINSIEWLEKAVNEKDESAFNSMNSAPYLGIKDKDKYLEKLYLDIKTRKEMFGSAEFIGIHECHLCCNKQDKYPYCMRPGKYGCVPLK